MDNNPPYKLSCCPQSNCKEIKDTPINPNIDSHGRTFFRCCGKNKSIMNMPRATPAKANSGVSKYILSVNPVITLQCRQDCRHSIINYIQQQRRPDPNQDQNQYKDSSNCPFDRAGIG